MDSLIILTVLCCLDMSASEARFCHQDEIADLQNLLQYELHMIEVERKRCLQTTNSSLVVSNSSNCSQVFDGIMCWPSVKAGTVSVQGCPSYMTSRLSNKNASRICLPDGKWYVHPVFNSTWTNLSACYDPDKTYHGPLLPTVIKEHLIKMKILYDIGYSISLVSLVIAVSIMLHFRKLHCQRNTIHVNLFVSFIFRSVICLMKDEYLIPEVDDTYSKSDTDIGVSIGQSTGCKIVYTLFYYVISSNCMWIFVEGIYMHSFVQSTKYNVSLFLYRTLLIVGWGFPCVLVVPWMIVRIRFENTLCWNIHDVDNGYIWIIKGPLSVTVVVNFCFFINIIRVLYTKLSAFNKRNPKRYRKLAKSTLILIPLFGVYYVVFIAVRWCMNPVLEVIWLYTEMFFNSFQGFAVSVLFCYMNAEVKREIKKVHRRRSLRQNSHLSNKSVSKSGDNELRIRESPSGNFHIELIDPLCNELCQTKHRMEFAETTCNGHDSQVENETEFALKKCNGHGSHIENEIELAETNCNGHTQPEYQHTFSDTKCNGHCQSRKLGQLNGHTNKNNRMKYPNGYISFEEESIHMLNT